MVNIMDADLDICVCAKCVKYVLLFYSRKMIYSFEIEAPN